MNIKFNDNQYDLRIYQKGKNKLTPMTTRLLLFDGAEYSMWGLGEFPPNPEHLTFDFFFSVDTASSTLKNKNYNYYEVFDPKLVHTMLKTWLDSDPYIAVDSPFWKKRSVILNPPTTFEFEGVKY